MSNNNHTKTNPPTATLKKTFIILLFLCFLIPPAHSQSISFTYSFLSQSPNSEIHSISPNEDTALSPADKLKIFLKPGKGTYIYLFLHDSGDGLYLLFPEELTDLDCCYTFDSPYTYPPGDEWALLDDTEGTEQFILIVSSTRLKNLEQLTNTYLDKLIAYWQDPADKRLEKAMAEARHKVLDRIRKERLEYSDFANIKEELVVIAGEFRAGDYPDDITGTKVTAEGFYAKTIRITHIGSGETGE